MQLPDFLITPRQLIEDKNIQPLDEKIYGVIYWTTNFKLQKCTLSNNSFAEILHANEKSISNSISRLQRAGYISIAYHGKVREILPEVVMGRSNLHQTMELPSNDEQKYISNKEPSTNVPSNSGASDLETKGQQYLDTFNQTYEKKYTAVRSILGNLKYWLEVYSIDEICKAVVKSKQDSYWAKILTPQIMLRRKNPRGEDVDYIAQFMNLPEPKTWAEKVRDEHPEVKWAN